MSLGIDRYLDAQYDVRASVPDFESSAALARLLSTEAYETLPYRTVAYGGGLRETADIFPQVGGGAPVFVYVHGGYWRASCKEDSAFVASMLHPAGAVVVVLEYALAPEARIEQIVDQIRRAMSWVYRSIWEYGGDPERIVIGGTSAGAHLVGMVLAGRWHQQYSFDEAALIGAIVLSGLFDITPLLKTRVNDWLDLDEQAAETNSPLCHLTHLPLARVVAAHGALETAEFASQTRRFAQAWRSIGGDVQYLSVPSHDHFSLPLDLRDPGSVVGRAALDLLGISSPQGR